ncbi:hypothetical protein HanIR_Chr00c23g0910371 [Helianthus annuus]|nr:hypothetical protein HanIR_Chr00c23g0910371 [Helianthus annuus]
MQDRDNISDMKLPYACKLLFQVNLIIFLEKLSFCSSHLNIICGFIFSVSFCCNYRLVLTSNPFLNLYSLQELQSMNIVPRLQLNDS